MRIESEVKLDFKDVLIRPKRSTLRSRSEVDLSRTFKFRHSTRSWSGVPVIAANMDHTGTFDMAIKLGAERMMTALGKFKTAEQWQQFESEQPSLIDTCFASTGISDQDFADLSRILKVVSTPLICIDVANGYTARFADFVKKARDHFPDHIIMAGNVVTGEMTEELILAGADIVKVGIGPGSVCTTRKKTGIGYPQLSAVIECADAAHGLKGHICADGGATNPGDVAKAFGAGADFVMLGGLLSGHDECEGEVIEKSGRQYKRFYGMSSAEAMNRHHGKVAGYRASEGKSVDVPYKGSVVGTIQDVLGGVRSTCTYVGARQLKELSKCTTFIRVTQQLNESLSSYNIQG